MTKIGVQIPTREKAVMPRSSGLVPVHGGERAEQQAEAHRQQHGPPGELGGVEQARADDLEHRLPGEVREPEIPSEHTAHVGRELGHERLVEPIGMADALDQRLRRAVARDEPGRIARDRVEQAEQERQQHEARHRHEGQAREDESQHDGWRCMARVMGLGHGLGYTGRAHACLMHRRGLVPG